MTLVHAKAIIDACRHGSQSVTIFEWMRAVNTVLWHLVVKRGSPL